MGTVAELAPMAAGPPQVLVVDASPLFAEALAHSLSSAQLPARAGSLDDLGDCTQTSVVLLDGDTVGEALLSAAANVRAAAPRSQLLLVVRADHPQPERATRSVQACGWIHRQSELEQVVRAVRQMLVGRRPAAVHPMRVVSAGPDLRSLTARETEVLAHIAEGRHNGDIAQALGISPNTVRTHVQSILGKLGVTSRLAAVAVAHEAGFRLTPAGPTQEGAT
jgi:DNA-binding NarL/FixJ family response regulator